MPIDDEQSWFTHAPTHSTSVVHVFGAHVPAVHAKFVGQSGDCVHGLPAH
jgi:hypothetical protein